MHGVHSKVQLAPLHAKCHTNQVHWCHDHNLLSNLRSLLCRLGVRLNGPRPTWARSDGGGGGSHPSNVHDHTYAIGTINFTGDMPVVLMVDGPSLGGFVCPATIVSTEMWKIGQVGTSFRLKLAVAVLGWQS